MKNEIWKDVAGYEGLYQVSNLGRVKSLKYRKKNEERVLARYQRKEKDYIRVQLWHGGKLKFAQVHRIEYEAFYGPIPEGMEVNHINEDKTDNRLENLNLMTRKENANWGTAIERNSAKRKNTKAFRRSARPVLQFNLDGSFIQEWPSQKEIERQLGFAQRNISAACRQLAHHNTAYNYVWRFKEC